MTWQRYRTIGWREYVRTVPIYDWMIIGIGFITLCAVLILSVIIVRGVAEVSDFRGQFDAQLDGMKRDILATVTKEREVRVAPLDNKVKKIETATEHALKRADSTDKKQKRLEAVVKPLEKALKDPAIAEKLAPILVPPPGPAETPTVMPDTNPKRGGALPWLFGN